jgi:putative transposase
MELYHILNRGTDKRKIFLNDGDRIRFVHDLYEFNNEKSANNTLRLMGRMNDLRNRSLERSPIVRLHGWCLMSNHYHLLLSETTEGGITKFIRRLNIGYAKFFNDKYKRVGTLFQGRTKKVLIDSDPHFLHILHYIHLNPLDQLKGASDWRLRRIKSAPRALHHLSTYRWSSYPDYCGRKNFPSLLSTELFRDVFGNYEKVLGAYIKDIALEPIQEFGLE